MSSAATRQRRKAHMELGESWGDVDYRDGEESSGSESSSASDSEDAEEEDATQRAAVNVSQRSPRRGPPSTQLPRQQVHLSPSTRLRARTSTPPTTTKRSHQSLQRTPEMVAPSFIMPSPSTQPEYSDSSQTNAISTNGARQRATNRRSSRGGSIPVGMAPSPLDESLGNSWVNAVPANMAPQNARQRSSRKKASRSPKLISSPVTQGSSASTYLAAIWHGFLQPTIIYLWSILKDTLNLLRPMFSYLLIASILYFFFWKGKNAVDASIRVALSPICNFPGASYLHLPFCPSLAIPGQGRFDALVEAQTRFEDVAKYSIQAAGLRQDMKTKEMAMRDLRSVIDYSNIASKQELGQILKQFIDGSKQSGNDISSWHARVDYALDRIIALNQHTLAVADVAHLGDDGMDLTKRIFVGIGLANRPKTRKDELADTYMRQASGMEEEIKRLIFKADSILQNLDGLEMLLDDMQSISVKEEVAVQGQRSELLGQLYTRLGGNRREKNRIESNLRTLNDVQTARHIAYTILSGALIKLRDIANYLENLREEMGRPQEDGFREVPMEVHLASIRASVERLEDVRDASKSADKRIRDRVWTNEEEDSPKMRTIPTIEQADME